MSNKTTAWSETNTWLQFTTV